MERDRRCALCPLRVLVFLCNAPVMKLQCRNPWQENAMPLRPFRIINEGVMSNMSSQKEAEGI